MLVHKCSKAVACKSGRPKLPHTLFKLKPRSLKYLEVNKSEETRVVVNVRHLAYVKDLKKKSKS